MKVGGFFGFGFAGDAEKVFGLGNDEKMGVFVKDFNSGGETRFRGGKAVGANGNGIPGGQKEIELGDGAIIDGDGLKFKPSAELLLFFMRPSGK